jgi:phosphoribosylaminoimidazole-succinocarboxamide synthase
MGLPQKQLSKEFVRQWLISEGFQGLEAVSIFLVMDDKIVTSISERYIEIYEKNYRTKIYKSTNK